MASLLLRLRSVFILTNLEVTRFISVLVRCNPWSQPPKLFFLRYFLVRYFKYLLENCFSETTYDFILEAFSVNDIPKISSFSIHFNLFPQKLFKISRIKNSIFYWMSKIQIKLPGWLLRLLVFLRCHLEGLPCDESSLHLDNPLR